MRNPTKRFMLMGVTLLLVATLKGSSAQAGFVTFPNMNRATMVTASGQTFAWSSGGISGTVTARPSGSITALTSNTPSAGNGREIKSAFYTGMHSDGGPVGVFYEFIFDKPIDITVYNAETLAGKERITLNTDGSPWTGGWYSVTTGNLVGIGTQSVAMSPSGPTPPHPYAAVSSKGVTRLEFENEILLAPGVPGTVGNSIEIQIDSFAVPEPTSMHLAVIFATVFVRYRRQRPSKCVGASMAERRLN